MVEKMYQRLVITLVLAVVRAGARAVNSGGPSVYQFIKRGQNLKLSIKASKKKACNWGGASMSIGGKAGPPAPPLSAGPGSGTGD